MNFNGDRLRIARIYRNMTISDLEKKISVTKQAISQYEKGIIAPKSEVLFQLVSVLRFPLDFFTEIDNGTNGYLKFPKLELPSIDYKNVIDIENVTLMLRGFWGLNNDPIVNIVDLLYFTVN